MDFSQPCHEIRTRALIYSFMLIANGKDEFFMVENRTSFRA